MPEDNKPEKKSSPTRELRKRLTDDGIRMTLRWAPRMPPGLLNLGERLVATAGPYVPVLSRTVDENMRAAGVWRPGVVERYFRAVARQFNDALRIYQLGCAADREPRRSPDTPVALARRRMLVDDSVRHLRQAVDRGRGVILAAPHVCNYLACVVRLNDLVPMTIFLRWSRNDRRREVKLDWFREAGLPVICEPPLEGDSKGRMQLCLDVLRQDRALFLPPDLIRKPGDGLPVRLFGRTLHLPFGLSVLAERSGAAVVPVFIREAGEADYLVFEEPIHVSAARRPGQCSPEECAARWAALFEGFVRRTPHKWFLWGDKRWTLAFRGDPKYYVQPIGQTQEQSSECPV